MLKKKWKQTKKFNQVKNIPVVEWIEWRFACFRSLLNLQKTYNKHQMQLEAVFMIFLPSYFLELYYHYDHYLCHYHYRYHYPHQRHSTAAQILRSLCHDVCLHVCWCVSWHNKTKTPDRNDTSVLNTFSLGICTCTQNTVRVIYPSLATCRPEVDTWEILCTAECLKIEMQRCFSC